MTKKKEGTTTARSRSVKKAPEEIEEKEKLIELVTEETDNEAEVEAIFEDAKEEAVEAPGPETVEVPEQKPVEVLDDNTDDDAPISWRKIGGGSFRMTALDAAGKRTQRIIKPNQVFMARPSEIPVTFLDVIKPLSEIPSVAAHEAPVTNAASYAVVPHPGKPGKFDVINATTKKALNARPLDKSDATEVLEKMS